MIEALTVDKPIIDSHTVATDILRTSLSKNSDKDFYLNLFPVASMMDCSQHKWWPADDVLFMRRALALAEQGALLGEVPVGAVLVNNGDIIAEGFNQPIGSHDPTAHAEIVALRCACLQLQNYRLPAHTTLYVTLEPCTMCMGALIHARLEKLVFATTEPRAGVVGSQMNLTDLDFYNHSIEVHHGLFQGQSQHLLKRFFKMRRQQKRIEKLKNKPTIL